MAKKAKAYTNTYRNRSKAKFSSVADRGETIGNNLSFGASEAYKLLRTNLIFSMADENKCKIVGMTSSLPGEGKSTTAMNLAYTLAQSGKRVLLLEGDMRLPVVASSLRIEDTIGLSHVLAGIHSLSDAVHQNVLIRNLSVLPAGEIPPNPSELLSSKRMELVLKSLAAVFEFIIIDLPPINAVSDSLAIARLLSGMIVVVRLNYCDKHSLADAMRQLELLQIKVLGFVLNGAETAEKRYKKYGRSYYRKGGYAYGYGKKETRTVAAADTGAAPIPTYDMGTESESGTDV